MKIVSKIIALFMFVAIFAPTINAQELQVKSFNADPSDISAVVYQVADANQNPCALLKVSVAGAKDLSFEGDIIRVEDKGPEQWVYMPAGSNWLNIKSSTNLPLRYDFASPVEGNTTYILNVVPKKEQGGLGDKFTVTLKPQSGVSMGGNSVDTGVPVKFDMILVKSGRFEMGATPEQESAEEDEKPVRWVVISNDFYMSETEVTQELYEYVMGTNPSEIKNPDNPVDNVSWDDAQAFVNMLNRLTKAKFRLPTEAEWEYAARGGHKTAHTKYPGSKTPDQVAWYYLNCSNRTQPVKSKDPNELGIYDMAGNVWELCEDYKNNYNAADKTDPLCTVPAKKDNRVRRGGAWDTRDINELRCSYRKRIPQDNRNNATGIRLVMTKP